MFQVANTADFWSYEDSHRNNTNGLAAIGRAQKNAGLVVCCVFFTALCPFFGPMAICYS